MNLLTIIFGVLFLAVFAALIADCLIYGEVKGKTLRETFRQGWPVILRRTAMIIAIFVLFVLLLASGA